MRYLIISALLLVACSSNQNSPSAAPLPTPPNSISKPTGPEQGVDGATKVDEREDCPHLSFDSIVLAKITDELMDDTNRDKFLLWEEDYGDDILGERQDDARVVFISNKVRYTVWYRGDMVSVWERPEGTFSDEFIQTYTDNLVDGCVNFGIMGSKDGDVVSRHVMHWNDASGDDVGVEESHGYWQGRYVFAMRGLAHTLGIK